MTKVDLPPTYRTPPSGHAAERRKKPVERPHRDDNNTKKRSPRKKPRGNNIDEYV